MKNRHNSMRWLGLVLACGTLTFAASTDAAKPPVALLRQDLYLTSGPSKGTPSHPAVKDLCFKPHRQLPVGVFHKTTITGFNLL